MPLAPSIALRPRRISRLDIPWIHSAAVSYYGPAEVPAPDRAREAYLRFVTEHPRDPLACTMDLRRWRWIPVAPARREEHAAHVVRATADPARGTEESALLAYRERAPHLPFVAHLGPTSLVFATSHAIGDPLATSLLFSAFLGEQWELLAAGTPRLRTRDLVRANIVQALRHPGCLRAAGRAPEWAERAPRVSHRAGELASDGPGDPRIATTRVAPESLAAVQHWREGNVPDVSMNAIVVAALHVALARSGVEVDLGGYHALTDTRRYLSTRARTRPGNASHALYVPADMTNPRSVAAAVRGAVRTRRPLRAALAGALHAKRLAARDSHQLFAPGAAAEVFASVTWSAERSGTIRWREPHYRRLLAFGQPSHPLQLNAFAVRLDGHMHVSLCYDADAIGSEHVHDALESLHDMPRLLGAEPAAAHRR